MEIEFENENKVALEDFNGDYFNSTGAEFYRAGDYDTAIEYYRIASSMGNVQSLANLGYCYYYGRGCKKDLKLAFAYFKMAARFKNTDALYKLSTMYEHGKGVKKNDEIAEYYLMTAFQSLNELPEVARLDYPSLLFAMGKRFLAIGEEEGDFEVAYTLFRGAQEGYEYQIDQGCHYYEKMLAEVEEILQRDCFDPYRDEENEEDLFFN